MIELDIESIRLIFRTQDYAGRIASRRARVAVVHQRPVGLAIPPGDSLVPYPPERALPPRRDLHEEPERSDDHAVTWRQLPYSGSSPLPPGTSRADRRCSRH